MPTAVRKRNEVRAGSGPNLVDPAHERVQIDGLELVRVCLEGQMVVRTSRMPWWATWATRATRATRAEADPAADRQRSRRDSPIGRALSEG